MDSAAAGEVDGGLPVAEIKPVTSQGERPEQGVMSLMDGARVSWDGDEKRTGARGDAIFVEPWELKQDRRAVAAVFLVCWVVYLATATYSVAQINDTRAATQSAYALATTGSLALPESWEGEADWEVVGRGGRSYTNRFPLMAIYAAPFHYVTDQFGSGVRPEHPHLINYAPSGVAAASAAALAMTVSFVLFRRLADRRLALTATGALAFATGVWTVSADALWPHALTHLFLALGVVAVADGRHARSGLAFGLSLLARPHLAVVPAILGIWSGVKRRSISAIALLGLMSALGLAAVVLYSRFLFGTWLPIAGYSTYAVDNLAGGVPMLEYGNRLLLFLGDPARGILVYMPVLIVLVPFVGRGWRMSPWWVRAAAVSGVSYMLLQLRVNAHHGGSQFFGPRLSIELTILAAPLLLRTYQAYHQGRRWAAPAVHVLLAFGVIFHGLGSTVWKHPFVNVDESWREAIVELCSGDDVPSGCPPEAVQGEVGSPLEWR